MRKEFIEYVSRANDVDYETAKDMIEEEVAYLESLGDKLTLSAVDESCTNLSVEMDFATDLLNALF